MLKSFEKKLEGFGFSCKGEKIVVAVSGGIDSMVLLDLFGRLKKDQQLRLFVAHVNHQLRGKTSDNEERLVKKISKKIGAGFFSARWNKPKQCNTQDAARDFRYNFFLQVSRKVNARFIATAHHRDDQAETVLLRLIRGCGIKGLGGMNRSSSFHEFWLIRPLIDFGRSEIEGYAKRRKLLFSQDETNLKTDYKRNFVRHKVIPILEELNPSIKEALADTAFAAQSNFESVNLIAETFAEEYFTRGEDKIAWNRISFLKLPEGLRHHVLSKAYEFLKGDLKDLNSDQIRQMDRLSEGRRELGRYLLPSGYQFHRRRDLLYIQSITS